MQRNELWNFSDYPLKDLFRIRDCWSMLKMYGLENEEGLKECEAEIERKTDDEMCNCGAPVEGGQLSNDGKTTITLCGNCHNILRKE